MSRVALFAAPLLLAALLGLGSCSDKPAGNAADAGQPMTGTDGRPVGAANQPTPAPAPADQVPAAPAETPEATAARNAAAVDRGQKLSGMVSDLSAAASDLGAQMTDMGLVINFNADVLFDFDKADIKPEADPTLQKLAEVVKQYTKSRVVINGYTDAKGNDAYNLTLSQRRAQAIADWLQQHGANAGGQLQTKGYGEANPVAPNTRPDGSDNPEGRQQNRRVEVIIS